jgi:hypothetical protein
VFETVCGFDAVDEPSETGNFSHKTLASSKKIIFLQNRKTNLNII